MLEGGFERLRCLDRFLPQSLQRLSAVIRVGAGCSRHLARPISFVPSRTLEQALERFKVHFFQLGHRLEGRVDDF